MNNRIRRGFTLPEVLVTVTVVAVLAAVVVPAVTGYVKKGDSPAEVQDVGQIRGALTSFVTDVRKYPATLTQLTTAITTSDKDVSGTNYTAQDTAAWKGPYFTSAVSSTTGFTSAGGLQVLNGLRDSASWIIDSVATPSTCGPLLALDTAFDKGDGRGSGAIVWSSAGTYCQQSAPTGTVAGAFLRLTPKP